MSPQTKEPVEQTVEQVRQSSRRTFLTLVAAASGGGGAVLWLLRKPALLRKVEKWPFTPLSEKRVEALHWAI